MVSPASAAPWGSLWHPCASSVRIPPLSGTSPCKVSLRRAPGRKRDGWTWFDSLVNSKLSVYSICASHEDCSPGSPGELINVCVCGSVSLSVGLCLFSRPNLRSSGSAGLEWILRICILKKHPGNSDAGGDPQSSVQVSVKGNQRSQYRPPCKRSRTGSPVCSRPLWYSPWATTDSEPSFHMPCSSLHCVQVTVVHLEKHPRPHTFPECREHLLQSIFSRHHSPVIRNTWLLTFCSILSPLSSDTIWFTELPDICIVIICKLSLKSFEGMTQSVFWAVCEQSRLGNVLFWQVLKTKAKIVSYFACIIQAQKIKRWIHWQS